ncbi:MAG: metalloregulator ArsR/SmtB family transcription factor [Anaerolineae bacterium]|nr:metalloregulator ArsR/SmtB family transcription factor [Anaerolineae bacterium]
MTYIHCIEALADPTRRALIERLQQGPCSVGELNQVVAISQPAVSQHLAVLKAANLVTVRKAGAKRIYSLAPEGLVELRRYIENLWDDVLAAFQQAAEIQNKGDQ